MRRSIIKVTAMLVAPVLPVVILSCAGFTIEVVPKVRCSSSAPCSVELSTQRTRSQFNSSSAADDSVHKSLVATPQVNDGNAE